jgi:predicted porin
VDLEGRIALVPVTGLTLAAGFYDGHRGQETAANPAENTATRWDVAVDYHYSRFNVGAEYFDARKWNQVQLTAPQPADEAEGESVWASVDLTAKLAVFARYDAAKPSKTLAAALKDDYFNVGVAFKPRKGIDLALVYKNERVADGSISTSNGTIGGINALTGGRYSEIGIWSQIAF